MKFGINILTLVMLVFLSTGMQAREIADRGNEEIFIECDRDIVFPGEQILFQCWLFSDIPSAVLSDYIYAELFTEDGKLLDQQVVLVKDGMATGSLILPRGNASGYYFVRAYTRYMKNRGESGFSYYRLMAINPADARFKYPEGKNGSARTRAGFEMHPVGGQILEYVNNKIFLEAAYNEKGLFKNAFVLNSDDDTVSIVQYIDAYTASFELFPEQSEYFLIFPAKPSVRPVKISGIRERGIKLSYQDNFDRLVFFIINRGGDLDSTESIKVYSLDKDASAPYMEIPTGKLMEIPKEKLEPGLNRFDLSSETETSSLYYLNLPDVRERLEVSAGSDKVLPGEEFEIRIRNINNSELNLHLRGGLENSASLLDNPVISNYPSVYSYYDKVLNRDISDPGQKEIFEAVYAPRFGNDHVRLDSIYFQKEKGPWVLTGKVNNHDATIDPEVYISVPGDSSMVFILQHDETGSFSFSNTILTGKKEIFIRSNKEANGTFINLDNPFYNGATIDLIYPDSADVITKILADRLYQNWYLGKILGRDEVKQSRENIPFFDQYDFFIELDDFKELPNMEEVFFEIVKNVLVFKKDKEPFLRVISRETNRTLGDNPLYVIDGIPVLDPAFTFILPPTSVKEIGVIARRYYIGSSRFDGIVVINTRSGDFPGSEFKYPHIRQEIVFPGNQVDIMQELDYRQSGEGIDTRSTFLWESVKIKRNQDDYTMKTRVPSIPGTYEIEVKGLSQPGNFPVSEKILIEVVDFPK